MKILMNGQTLLVLSGLFTNLSAAWLATIVVAPAFTEAKTTDLLTTNLGSGILSLTLAIWLARKGNEL